ncbi:MAG: hypothetical protein GYB68_06695 [Chloroflexi bacterium]|nr:hypothetical protein [Chloroflexota bacterium]
MTNSSIEDLLAEHRTVQADYHVVEQHVKDLLRGRRMKDLSPDDMAVYRELSERRDALYNRMRQLERRLLDGVPGASTTSMPRLKLDDSDA